MNREFTQTRRPRTNKEILSEQKTKSRTRDQVRVIGQIKYT